MENQRSPDLNWIIPGLALGGKFGSQLIEPLAKEWGIQGCVDLREEERDDATLLIQHGIELLHLPTPDFTPPSLTMIDEGVRWLDEALRAGKRVLVHCQYGKGRSVVLACCFLISRGHAPSEALFHVKCCRPSITPSPSQLQALLNWTSARQATSSSSSPSSPSGSLAELTRIAYFQPSWERAAA